MVIEPDAELRAATVIADFDAIAKLVCSLDTTPSLIDLYEAALLVEAVVLNDNLVLVHTPHGEASPEQLERCEALLNPWRTERALDYRSFTPPPPIPDPVFAETVVADHPTQDEIAKRGTSVEYSDMFGDILGDGLHEAARLIEAERHYGCPGFALPRQRPFYDTTAHVMYDHVVCNLSGKYDDVSRALQELRIRFRPKRYYTLPIPPIALDVMLIARTPSDLIPAAMHMRDHYRKLRQRLNSLRDLLDDPDVSPMKKVRHEDKWLESWKTLELGQLKSRRNFVQVANTSAALINVPAALVQTPNPAEVVNTTRLIQQFLAEAKRQVVRWRVRPLHVTANRYMKTPDARITKEITRVLGRPVEGEEMERAAFVAETLQMMSGKVVVVHL
jgi:hypothetical protein